MASSPSVSSRPSYQRPYVSAPTAIQNTAHTAPGAPRSAASSAAMGAMEGAVKPLEDAAMQVRWGEVR
jgi:hypothetical protein